MKNNIFIKFVASFPVILIALYFIPFLGVSLILLRCFISDSKKRISTPILIIGVEIIILVPKVLDFIFRSIKFDTTKIPYFDIVLKLYSNDFIKYSKLLICVGIIFLIISFILKTGFERISSKLNNCMQNYINETRKRDYEISKQNDLKIKLKQEKAKNTSYIKCPNCGSDNLLGEKFGTCKYCKKQIENKNYRG